jgi:hypothetical protein
MPFHNEIVVLDRSLKANTDHIASTPQTSFLQKETQKASDRTNRQQYQAAMYLVTCKASRKPTVAASAPFHLLNCRWYLQLIIARSPNAHFQQEASLPKESPKLTGLSGTDPICHATNSSPGPVPPTAFYPSHSILPYSQFPYLR